MKIKKYLLSILLMLSLLIITYFVILKDCDFNLLISSIKNTNPWYLLLACISIFMYITMGSLLIKCILKYFKHHINMYQAFGYHFTEVYFSSITPSYVGGQPVQMYEMKKDGISYEESSLIIFFTNMLNRLVLIILASILFIIYFKEIFGISTLYNILIGVGYVSTLLIIFLFASLIYSKKIANLVLKIVCFFIDRFKFIKNKNDKKDKFKEMIKNYQACAKITKENPKLIIESFIITFFQRIFLLLTSYLVYLAFGLSKYSLLLVITFQICVTLGSDLMPTPGGVMVNEGLLLGINKLLYGKALALSGMIMQRSLNFYILIIISGIFYIIFHFRKKFKKIS